MFSTQAGFESTTSESSTQSTETSTSVDTSKSQTDQWSKTESFGYDVAKSIGGEVGFEGFGVKGRFVFYFNYLLDLSDLLIWVFVHFKDTHLRRFDSI